MQVETGASDSLASYPGENGTAERQFPKVGIQNADKYYSDQPAMAPRPEPHVENDLESQDRQVKLYLATREVSRLFSQIVDDRRTPISDRERVKAFMRDFLDAMNSD